MMEAVKDNNKDFFVLREEQSELFPSLNKAQEIIIQQLALGKSYSYIAKNVFGIHYTTMIKQTKSLAFIQALTGVNKAKDVATLEEVRVVLTNIIRTSNNLNATINACRVLISMGSLVTADELAESIKEDEMNLQKAKEILRSLGLEEGEE